MPHYKPGLFLVITLFFASIVGAADLPRQWKNSVGMTMEAALLEVEGNRVSLLLNSGKIVMMPIDKLSPADQEYVRHWRTKDALDMPTASPSPGADAQTPAPAASATVAPAATQPPTWQAALQPQNRPRTVRSGPSALEQVMNRKNQIPDPKVQPKSELFLTFPELGMSRSDNEPLGMHIRIPEHYSPDRPVPLFLWLSGGDGSSRFSEPLTLVNKEDFVLVGMNYPLSVPLPMHIASKGRINELWEIQDRMVARLLEVIPNLDPKLRIIGGFSNGAHTIGACLGQNQTSFYKFFNVYILIEGGDSDLYNYPPLPGHYFYAAWGNGKGGDGDDFGNTLATAARKAQMKVEAHPMVDIGHEFPAFEERRVRAWIYDTVIPGLSPGL